MSDDSQAASAAPGAAAVSGLVSVLRGIDTGRPSRTVLGAGHYASVIALDDRTGIAFCADGVGTKVIIAEQMGRFDTIGIDCVAMNVNDIICVGAEPLALVDYIAVEAVDPDVLRAIAEGLRAGAEQAGVEIPGGELAELPELIRGHPSPRGFDLAAACIGTVPLDRIMSGAAIRPGDAVIGVPSSGIHSNGLTLARRVLLEQAGHDLADAPAGLGRPLGEELLEPTAIYVRAVTAILGHGLDVHGLAHITGDGLLNLLRLNEGVGYEIYEPLPSHPIFDLIAESGKLPAAAMYEAFNMGTGFCCIVGPAAAEETAALLAERHPGARRIGEVSADTGVIRVPPAGIAGEAGGFREL